MRSLPSPAAIVTRRFTTACQALPATTRLRRRHIQLWYSRVVNPTNLANWCRPRALPTLAYSMLLLACGMQPVIAATEPDAPPAAAFTADGRSTLEQLSNRYQSLSTEHGWTMETVYQYHRHRRACDPRLAHHTPRRGTLDPRRHPRRRTGWPQCNCGTPPQHHRAGGVRRSDRRDPARATRRRIAITGATRTRRSGTGARAATASAMPNTCLLTRPRAIGRVQQDLRARRRRR